MGKVVHENIVATVGLQLNYVVSWILSLVKHQRRTEITADYTCNIKSLFTNNHFVQRLIEVTDQRQSWIHWH